jgi:hypothetical protein
MTTNFGDASMVRSRRYHPLVAEHPASAAERYDSICTDLGNRFRVSVRDRIHAITERPDSLGQIHQQYRAAMLNQFPYVILFEQKNQVVTILVIFHAASDPEGWFDRSV